VARTATNKVANLNVKRMKIACPTKLFLKVEKNIADEIALIMRMFMYSAIKIKAKLPPPYSTLNPDTNSDSPSAKSKGVRLVSANKETNQHKNSGGAKNTDQETRSNNGVVKL